jgi:hypothetical protein
MSSELKNLCEFFEKCHAGGRGDVNTDLFWYRPVVVSGVWHKKKSIKDQSGREHAGKPCVERTCIDDFSQKEVNVAVGNTRRWERTKEKGTQVNIEI